MAKPRAFPSKGQDLRVPFIMRDTSLSPITAPWTGANAVVMLDGVVVATLTPTQITGSHWGYVDISSAYTNGGLLMVTATITNANAKPVDIAIPLHDMAPHANLPEDMDQLLTLLYSRFFRTHSSDGTNLTVYADDDVTMLSRQALSTSPYKVEKSF